MGVSEGLPARRSTLKPDLEQARGQEEKDLHTICRETELCRFTQKQGFGEIFTYAGFIFFFRAEPCHFTLEQGNVKVFACHEFIRFFGEPIEWQTAAR